LPAICLLLFPFIRLSASGRARWLYAVWDTIISEGKIYSEGKDITGKENLRVKKSATKEVEKEAGINSLSSSLHN